MASIGKWLEVIEERCDMALYAKLSSLELILHVSGSWPVLVKDVSENLMKAVYIVLRKVYIHKIFLIISESLGLFWSPCMDPWVRTLALDSE